MYKLLPKEIEAPEKQYVITGAIYSIVCFFSLPFLFRLISDGFYNDPAALSWFEIAFHSLNFLVIFMLFREYLEDSLLNFQLHKEEAISAIALVVGLMLGIGVVWHFLYLYTGNSFISLAAFGTLPLTEMDILTLSGDVIYGNPIFGTLCMAILTPAVTSCIYYAIGFAPFYNIRPWLGYLVVSIAVLFPRLCNVITGWDATTEFILYAVQLPMHLIACWSYQKTDTVWTPMISLIVANLISSIALIVVY